MDQRETDSSRLDERRQFVERLRAHDDVAKLDFTRNGFRTVFVEVEQETGFHAEWQQTATKLGYGIEHQCAGIYRLTTR